MRWGAKSSAAPKTKRSLKTKTNTNTNKQSLFAAVVGTVSAQSEHPEWLCEGVLFSFFGWVGVEGWTGK